MPKYKRVKRGGKDVVVVEQEAIVQIPMLRQNREQYVAERDRFQAMIDETDEMISEVAAVAPDLLAAADKANGVKTPPKSRQQKRATKRKSGKKRRAG
jgi:hypothetical protein